MEPKPTAKPLSESRPTAGLQCTPYSSRHCCPIRLCARCNVYDNVMEFWVVTRERGSQEDAREIEDKKRSLEKAWRDMSILKEIFGVNVTCINVSPNTQLNILINLCEGDAPVAIADGMFNDLEEGVNRMDRPTSTAEAGNGSAPPTEDAIMNAKNIQGWRVCSSLLFSF